MKTMKKLFCLALTIVLALALAAPAFAVDNATITINNGNEDATYSAYQIMSLVQSGENYAYTVSEAWKQNLIDISGIETKGLTPAAVNNALVAYVADQTGDDTRVLAEALYDCLSGKTATVTGVSPLSVPQGYYLIVETTDVGEGEVKSLVMLDTAGDTNLEIDSKRDTVTVDKKVDGHDAVTAEFNQTVTFTITSKIPSNIAQYDDYTFIIEDMMSTGLDFASISSVYVNDVQVNAYSEQNQTGYTTSGFFTGGADKNGTGTIDLSEYILANKTSLAEKNVVITYTATVNNTAVIDDPDDNYNAVKIQYSDDYHAGTTGYTVEDKVFVSVFDIDVFKYYNAKGDGDTFVETGLPGAQFELTKVENGDTKYASFTDGANGAYKFAGWAIASGDNTKLVSPADGNITVDGLKDGTYTLTEVKAPDGYNLLDAPITVVIANNGDVTVNEEAAEPIKVLNQSGTELPSTGGMGTTIFYTLGGVLVVGAAVLLVTKKRMNNAE